MEKKQPNIYGNLVKKELTPEETKQVRDSLISFVSLLIEIDRSQKSKKPSNEN
jgi:hypothetical protein